jgi:hypothetical protein
VGGRPERIRSQQLISWSGHAAPVYDEPRISLAAIGVAWGQAARPAPPGLTPAFAAASPPAVAPTAGCANPNALRIARTVEIDTTGGPGFGFEHFKMHDFLQPGEVVLTFDDGPWLNNTAAVLAALAQHCTKAPVRRRRAGA